MGRKNRRRIIWMIVAFCIAGAIAARSSANILEPAGNKLHQLAESRLVEQTYGMSMDSTSEFDSDIAADTSCDPSVSAELEATAEPEQQAEDYRLKIEGESGRLSSIAWEQMQQWRRQMEQFAEEHKDQLYLHGPNRKQVALTFDDGPDATNTEAVLDVLSRYGVKGNFFFVGRWVEKYPEAVKRADEEGHLVLNHSYRHDELTKLSPSQVEEDLIKTEKAIAGAIGKRPAILRTPYGETDEQVLNAAGRLGYSVVLWSLDTLDWSLKEKDGILDNVKKYVRNGEIILMHSAANSSQTVKALPAIIEYLQENGYDIVDLSELLGIEPYK